jgi:hypothetical protein
LHLPVRGYLALRADDPQHETDRLVQALFSAGFLGQVALLAPHRSEFIGQIALWQESDEPRLDKRDFENLLNSGEIARVEEIARLVDTAKLTDPQIQMALRNLRSLSFNAFVYIESLSGKGWRDRLDRLLGYKSLVAWEPVGLSIGELRELPEFKTLASLLSERSRVRPLATALDAAALTSLIVLNRTARENPSSIFPRYFTSSRSIKALYRRSPWLREQLSFVVPGSRRGTVWRDARYYFLRSIFPSLRLNSSRASTSSEDAGPSLADMQDLLGELHRALDAGRDDLSDVVKGRLLGGSEILEILSDLERSRMSRVWANLDESSLPVELMTSLRGVARLSREERVRRFATDYETEVEQRLSQEIRDRRISLDVVEAVGSAVADLGRSKYGPLSLTRDLGSVRWGLEYPESDDRDALKLVDERGEPDAGEVLRAFDVDALRADANEALRSMAVLLGLEKFDVASDLFREVGRPGADRAHALVGWVARLGSRRPMTEANLAHLMSVAQASWDSLGSEDRSRFVLGYAYAAFAAWSRSASGGAWSLSSPRDDQGWARWSIRIVTEHFSSLTPLAQLYCVNHLIYVSARAGLPEPQGGRLLADFERLAELRDDFRFLDTAGFALFRRAENILESASLQEQVDVLDRAVRYLERASEIVPNDFEVRQHLEVVRTTLHQARAR